MNERLTTSPAEDHAGCTTCSTAALPRRRSVLLGASAAAAVPVLAACSGGESAATDPAAATPSVQPTPATESAVAPPSGVEVGDAADVPVGGYAVYANAQMVITQPEAGSFLGFTSICTHQGCPVSPADRDGDPIVCKCHFSEFSLTDGSVLKGPARKALASIPIAVAGGKIYKV